MKTKIAENIRALRRERALTQEQLAEALGVSAGSVSKWESSQTTPELDMIMDLADLFEISVDALLGYEFRNNDREHLVRQIQEFRHTRAPKDGLAEAEKALKRYPNHFDIVYNCAHLFFTRGLTAGDETLLRRSLDLMNYALLLIDQNQSEEISEQSLYTDIAEAHSALNEFDKAVEILKEHNPMGINNHRIGYTLASGCKRPDEARSYLSDALLQCIVAQFQIALGYANSFCAADEHRSALDILNWALSSSVALRDPRQTCFLEKTEAALFAAQASIWMELQDCEKAKDALRCARDISRHFDSAPVYRVTSLRFIDPASEKTSHDDFGETAMDGVRSTLSDDAQHKSLLELWEEILAEESE